MINPFVIKKWGALLLVGFFAAIGLTVGLIYYGFWVGLICCFVCMGVGSVIGNLMLKNPFTGMLEGQGILVMDVNSTGIIKPFLVQVNPPYITGKHRGKDIEDIFNRSSVFQMRTPVVAKKKAEIKLDNEGGIKIELGEDDYYKARFQLNQWPLLLYNAQIDSILTKDYIAASEKETFAEHTVLYLNSKMKELTSAVRDFGRYVVETLKPKTNLLQSKLFWFIVIIGLVLIGALFFPAILEAIGGAWQGGTEAVSTAAGNTGGNLITPK